MATQDMLRAAGAQAPRRGPPRAPHEGPPGGAPEAFRLRYMHKYMHETQATNCVKRLPKLEKAYIMPWDALEKKRADHTHTQSQE